MREEKGEREMVSWWAFWGDYDEAKDKSIT